MEGMHETVWSILLLQYKRVHVCVLFLWPIPFNWTSSGQVTHVGLLALSNQRLHITTCVCMCVVRGDKRQVSNQQVLH